ncbi:MAG: transcriptional regulator [Pseudonocardiales bacterium]|nr:transcriptional regulator [Pseudonocardiales bacterium]
MKLSGGVEWALHCCVVLSAATAPVPAGRLAELHDVSPTYLAKQLQALARAGLIASTQGHSGGYSLTRAPAEITVLDIVEAVGGATPAFACTEIRQRGPMASPPSACVRPCAINRAMTAADDAWRTSLRAVSVADLAGEVNDDYDVDVFAGIRGWLSGPS